MKIVLDASAALAAIIPGSATDAILETLDHADVVIAPDQFAMEMASAVRKYASARQLEPHAAARLVETALGLVDRFSPSAGLAQESVHEASAWGFGVADVTYAVLARREGAPVLTIDRKLEKLLAEMRVGMVKLRKAKA